MKVDEAAVKRCVQHLAAVKRAYPDAWKQVDSFRAARGKDLQLWPRWCYMPLSGAYAIVSGGGNARLDTQQVGRVGPLGALAAWRPAKAIYQFDPTVFEAIWETPVDGPIPIDVLQTLPTWCCYIPFPDRRTVLATENVVGFYVHLEHDVNSGRMELRFVFDVDFPDFPVSHWGLVPIPLHLGGSNLSENFESMLAEANSQKLRLAEKEAGIMADAERDIELREYEWAANALKAAGATSLAPLVSLTLYLCSTTAEIRPRDPMRGVRCKPAKTKKGPRDFGPDQPVMWEVAYRLGATLRAAAEAPRSSGNGDGTHASPRAHIRRAHWHAFWTGPKAKPGKIVEGTRELILHWIPPTPVMVGEDGVIPTVHRVTT